MKVSKNDIVSSCVLLESEQLRDAIRQYIKRTSIPPRDARITIRTVDGQIFDLEDLLELDISWTCK
jgi:hypothetical protein